MKKFACVYSRFVLLDVGVNTKLYNYHLICREHIEASDEVDAV